MNEAIKLAIEKGGWDGHGGWQHFRKVIGGWRFYDEEPYTPSVPGVTFSEEEIICDPLFWQALGKALGWEERGNWFPDCPVKGKWIFYAVEYYKLVLTGGDTEKFWRDTLH